MNRAEQLIREADETIFYHRGLEFRELPKFGIQVYHPELKKWFNTDFLYKWKVLQDVFPDIGLWYYDKNIAGSRNYYGSLKYPEGGRT